MFGRRKVKWLKWDDRDSKKMPTRIIGILPLLFTFNQYNLLDFDLWIGSMSAA